MTVKKIVTVTPPFAFEAYSHLVVLLRQRMAAVFCSPCLTFPGW